MKSKTRVLAIDDDVAIRKFLIAALGVNDFEIIEAATGGSAIQHAAAHNPDIILLDLGLPDIDGIVVTQRIREWSNVPIIVLSARGDEGDKVAALDCGANDYLTKPFSVPELLARIRVHLRHLPASETQAIIQVQDVVVNIPDRIVKKSGVEIHLTPSEFKLFVYLARFAGRVLTHSQILREVWGPEYSHELHYLRVYSRRLREKLETDPDSPKLIMTETGVGYRLRTE